jgi:nitrite reductase (NADH) small subunit
VNLGRWVRAARADEIPPGKGKPIEVGDRILALYNDGGVYFAIDDTCPHQGASLGEGTLHEGRVICPWHNFVFELRTGHCRGVPQANVACYPTRRSGVDVEVELPDRTGQEPA